MSLEHAQYFVSRIHEDEDFRNSVADQRDRAARMAHLKRHGLEFTDEELREAYKQRCPELTDEEISAISSGSTDVRITYINRSNDADNPQIVAFTKNS